MTNPTVLNRVRHIVADLFSIPVEQITQESSPDTIEAWDSLQHLNLVLALEQEFSVQLMPEEIEQLLSIQDIVTLLAEKPHTTERLL